MDVCFPTTGGDDECDHTPSLFISSSIRKECARIFSPTLLILSRIISSKIISRMGKTRAAKIKSIPKNNSAITYLHTLPCKKNAMIALPIEAPAIARGVVNKKELQMKIDIVIVSPGI
jgi:hypothetical protein